MIKLKEIKPHVLSIDAAYLTEDNSAVEISNELSLIEEDYDYKIYNFSLQGMLTLNPNGEWADFECISPDIVTQPLCTFDTKLHYETGTPIFEVLDENNISAVLKQDEGFVLWLKNACIINHVIQNDIIEFYLCDDELIAIHVKKAIIPE